MGYMGMNDTLLEFSEKFHSSAVLYWCAALYLVIVLVPHLAKPMMAKSIMNCAAVLLLLARSCIHLTTCPTGGNGLGLGRIGSLGSLDEDSVLSAGGAATAVVG
jgi:hypothetical protein